METEMKIAICTKYQSSMISIPKANTSIRTLPLLAGYLEFCQIENYKARLRLRTVSAS